MARSVVYELLIRYTVDLQVAVKASLTTLGGQFVADKIYITPDQYPRNLNPPPTGKFSVQII